jgi:hypothetical protein
VRVHRLAGDEEAHDLAGALEDAVDAEVAHHPLHRDRQLAARRERVGRLVAAPAADLQAVVHDLPPHLRRPQLGDGGFQADVVLGLVRQRRRQLGHRLDGEGVGGHVAQHLRHGVVLAHGRAPLHPLRRPLARDLHATLAPYAALMGSVRRPVFSVISASFSPFPSPQITFSRGTRTLSKRITAFCSARSPMKWQRCVISTPGVSTSTTNAVICGISLPFLILGRRLRHHHQQLGQGAVGAPQLLAVEDVGGAVLAERGRGGERRRVRPHPRLGEREGGDGALRQPRQVLLLLLRRAEHLHRLRHADRLVGGEEGGEVAVLAGHHPDGAPVAELRKPDAAVLFGILSPNAPRSRSPCTTSGGSSPVRSMASESTSPP